MWTKKQKIAAQRLVNNAVKKGRMCPVSLFACVDCGKQAAHYDHAFGYDPEHTYDVQPVCVSCHSLRAWARGERDTTRPAVAKNAKRMGLGNHRAKVCLCYGCFKSFRRLPTHMQNAVFCSAKCFNRDIRFNDVIRATRRDNMLRARQYRYEAA